MCSDVVIKATGLSKQYAVFPHAISRIGHLLAPNLFPVKQAFWALQGVDLSILKGETVGIVGRNGSGKSTLLQMLCGTLSPTSGSYSVNGRVAALLELGAGFNAEFTGRENVYLSAKLYGLGQEEIHKKFDSISEFADIGEFLDQPVKTYSSGMLVRLAFAVIAHVDADILVVDEALAVGDAFFVQKCMRFLREFAKTKTLLFVSHDTDAVVNLCTKAILLSGGKAIYQGDPREVSDYYLKMQQEDSNATGNDRFKFVKPKSNDFGTGAAMVQSARLMNADGEDVQVLKGGETLSLSVQCKALEEIDNPLVGFVVRDRLGQMLFSATSATLGCIEGSFSSGEVFELELSFVMPLLNAGDYCISAAIGQGDAQTHVHHHWAHDVLSFKVQPERRFGGLLGVDLKTMKLRKGTDFS